MMGVLLVDAMVEGIFEESLANKKVIQVKKSVSRFWCRTSVENLLDFILVGGYAPHMYRHIARWTAFTRAHRSDTKMRNDLIKHLA